MSSPSAAGAYIYEDLDPAKTALVVVDMQNAFMLPGVAHALCPMAEKIVPNINRLAHAVRESGGTVIWIKTTFKDDALQSWSTYFEMVTPQQGAKRIAALTADSKGHELWAHARRAAGRPHRREEPLQRLHPGLVESRRGAARRAASTRCSSPAP